MYEATLAHNDSGAIDGPPRHMAVHIEHSRCVRTFIWTDARMHKKYVIKDVAVPEYTEIMNKLLPEDRPGPGVAHTISMSNRT